MMKKNRKYTVTDRLITKITSWIAAVITLLLIIWGIRTWWDFELYEQTDDAQVEEYINPVISRADGFITAVKFEENQIVKKGDTLILIDQREYVIDQQQIEAAILKEEAHLLVLESTIHTLDDAASANKAQIKADEARVWRQDLDYKRYKELYDVESATKQQLEDMEAKLEITKGDLQASQEKYSSSRSKIHDVEAEKLVVKAEIKRLNALLERKKLGVSYTVITASYNGRMGKRTIEVGQMIDVGEVLAFIVDNETDKWVVANYKETQIEDLQIGDKVEFTADAYSNHTFHGKIISMSPATGSSFSLLPPDNATGYYVKIVQRIPVRIKVIGNEHECDMLKAGMNVNVSIRKEQ